MGSPARTKRSQLQLLARGKRSQLKQRFRRLRARSSDGVAGSGWLSRIRGLYSGTRHFHSWRRNSCRTAVDLLYLYRYCEIQSKLSQRTCPASIHSSICPHSSQKKWGVSAEMSKTTSRMTGDPHTKMPRSSRTSRLAPSRSAGAACTAPPAGARLLRTRRWATRAVLT